MYKELAIIAPTASGKTILSIELAHKLNAVILSLDSLAVYKQINIASAKPTKEEMDGIIHFGINKVFPNEKFDVMEFIEEYRNAKSYAKECQKNLIIVGGTGFYLKSMIDGLSYTPKISNQTKQIAQEKLKHMDDTYKMLLEVDNDFIAKISSTDKYRIQKVLEIYIETKMIPSEYFFKNKPKPIIDNLKIFEIQTEVGILRDRIKQRTKQMLQNGIIDEVIKLEKLYTRRPSSMRSIGIVETLGYLDGKLTKQQLEDEIFIHTAQLAKRQRTFNKSQFNGIYKETLQNLEKKILSVV